MKVLAVDPSLTCSGWALFEEGSLVGVGKIKGGAPGSLAVRLARIQTAVASLLSYCQFGAGDVLVCEGPTTMRDPSAAIKVEQVRGIFEVLARSSGATVPGRINPRSVHRQVMGMSGKQLARPLIKQAAARSVQLLFADDLARMQLDFGASNWKRHQDILDAILIGYLANKKIETAASSQTTLMEVFEGKADVMRSRSRQVNES